jgi:hypothetical protein
MALKTITISVEKYNVLRKTFKQAIDIIDSLGMGGSLASEGKAPKPEPKRTKSQKINDYKKLIESGQRGKKPEYLKK